MAGQGPDRYRDDVTRKLPYLYPLRMTRNGVAWPGHIPAVRWDRRMGMKGGGYELEKEVNTGNVE